MNSKAEDFNRFQDKCIPNYAVVKKSNHGFYTFYSNESKINCLMELAKHMIMLMDDFDKAHPPKLMIVPAPNLTPSVIICEYIQIDDHLIIKPYHLSLIVMNMPGVGECISYTYNDNEKYYSDVAKEKLKDLPDNIIKKMFAEIILNE